MDIILLERVEKLGQMGDLVQVKDGYARNFLLPKGKGMRATEANKKAFEGRKVELEARSLERKTEADAVAGKLNGTAIVLIRQAGESGQLYGSVSARDIADALTEKGFHVDKGQIVLGHPIKALGLSDQRVQLHPEVTSTVTINVARSEEEAERQARGENIFATEEEREEALDIEDVFETDLVDEIAGEIAASEANEEAADAKAAEDLERQKAAHAKAAAEKEAADAAAAAEAEAGESDDNAEASDES